MKPALALALCLAATASASAQTTFTDPANLRGERVSPRDGRELPIDQGATGLQQLLRKLNTRASLMNIVAHPDDEDGGMLTLYSRGLGARVADLSLNRGEGGQNAMTADFEDALGLLRTQELLACDRYSGVDQFFGTQVDFGFSKTKSESFAKWGHDKVLYDVVRAIRLYRPLVITSTWIGGVTDGHGQHQVSGQIAQEAFVAAGDPKVFPELTAEDILPWQPLRIYARVPMQSITPQGLFDYATGQYVPAEFHNYVTGETSTAAPSVDVVVHEGTKDPLITYAGAHAADLSATGAPDTPLSYVQFSRIGLGLQRSQIGPGVRNAPTGTFDVSYHLYGDLTCNAPATLKPQTPTTPAQNCHAVPAEITYSPIAGSASTPAATASIAASALDSQPSFFDGIDTSIEGITSLAVTPSSLLRATFHALGERFAAINQGFDPTRPEAIAASLTSALGTLDTTIQIVENSQFQAPYAKENILHELRIKRVQLNQALALAFGLYISADNSGTIQVAGKPLQLRQPPHLVQSVEGHLTFVRGWSESSSGSLLPSALPEEANSFAAGKPLDFSCDLAPSQTTITRPYFTRTDIEQPVYRLSNPALRNAPSTPPALTCWAELEYNGVHFELGVVTVDSIVPAVNARLYDKAIVLPEGSTTFPVRGSVEATGVSANKLTFTLPQGWTSNLLKSYGSYQEFRVTTAPPPTAPLTFHAATLLSDSSTTFTEGYQTIGYPGIPTTNLYANTALRLVPANLRLPEKRSIAYLPGTGDPIQSVLLSIGIPTTTLTVADLVPEKLKQYDTVILGVRTYNAHPDLHGRPTQALLDYARNGGNVLVQFQTTEFTADDAPYPLSLGSNEKVVDETAPVQLLAKSNAILTTPNLLTPADFNGWNEERGHGFLSTWDDHYTPLLEVHDPGEPTEHILPQKPQRGGLITVQLGKGRWTYCAFALYRQLPEAVPGAFRLFANLITP